MTETTTDFTFDVYWKDELTASVSISSDRKYVQYKKYTNEIPKIPYLFDNPSVEQINEFLLSRCMDAHRTQLDEYLKDLEINEFNPYEIIKKTHGTMWEDFMWLKFPEETITWKDVCLRG